MYFNTSISEKKIKKIKLVVITRVLLKIYHRMLVKHGMNGLTTTISILGCPYFCFVVCEPLLPIEK